MGGNLMRTVTFADQNLVDVINESFVPVWHNQSPTVASGGAVNQQTPTAEQVAAYPQGGGGDNVLGFFSDSQGRLIHCTRGYWSAENFAKEFAFAKQQFELMAEKEGGESSQPDEIKTLLVASLKRRIETLSQERSALESANPLEMKKPFSESEIRRQHAAIGLLIDSCQLATVLCGTSMADRVAEQLERNFEAGVIS